MSYLDPPEYELSRRPPRHERPVTPDGYPPAFRATPEQVEVRPGAVSPPEREPDPQPEPEVEAPPPTRSAGRNLPVAIGVGLTLGAIVITSLVLWRPGFLILVAAAAMVGVWEMVRAVGRADTAHPPLVPLLGGCLAIVALAWYAGAEAVPIGLVLTVVAVMVWRLPDGPRHYHGDLIAAVLVAVYVPFLGSFAILLDRPSDGTARVIVTLAAVVLSDTGGYAAGVLFGRHKMVPSVSPGKTWEGTAGSLVIAAAGAAVLFYLVFHVAWWRGAIFGLGVAGAAVLGDLAESLLKRDLKIKDMSNLLPGHGGLMDRLDSILFAVPTAFVLFAALVPAS